MPDPSHKSPNRKPSPVPERASPDSVSPGGNATPAAFALALVFTALMVAGLWWFMSRPSSTQTTTAPSQPRTAAQNLAILSGRPADDPATATALERLDGLCPETDVQVADLLVNMQSVLDKAGKHYELPYLMEQLGKAQEGSEQSCLATGTALSLMLEK